MKSTDSVIVGYDYTHGREKSVLIVGRKKGRTVEIVNAFQGEEAETLYKKLITVKEKNNG